MSEIATRVRLIVRDLTYRKFRHWVGNQLLDGLKFRFCNEESFKLPWKLIDKKYNSRRAVKSMAKLSDAISCKCRSQHCKLTFRKID